MNKEIINYIKTLSDNEKIQELLIKTIGNILLNQNDFKKFIKENEDKIIHIKDWMFSIIENNEEWKNPRVLTIDALNNTADKYFEKKNNKIQTINLDEKHEKLIDDLEEYYIVQMLTPQALDNESKIMQHCIGHGYYDQNLKDEEYQYFSLRDKFNKAHVTLEIKNNKILQLQGKQNQLPYFKYLENLLPWLINNNYKNIPWLSIGQYYDIDKKEWFNFNDVKVIENIDYAVDIFEDKLEIIFVYNEKANFYYNIHYFGDKIYLICNKDMEITDFIDNKTKNRLDLEMLKYLLKKEYKNIPYHLSNYIYNKNDNEIYSIYEMPDNCETTSRILLESSDIKKIPNNLIVNGNLDLNYCFNLREIPSDLIVNGDLNLSNTIIFDIENINVSGNVFFGSSETRRIHKNLNVGLDLDLSNSFIERIPDNTFVGRNFIINNNHSLKELPDNLTCKTIFIDQKQIYLIKETMNFETIKIKEKSFYSSYFLEYSKKDFISKFLKMDSFTFGIF